MEATDHPLVAMLRVGHPSPVGAEISVEGVGVSFTIPVGDVGNELHIPIGGMRADATYEIQVQARRPDGETVGSQRTFSFSTGSLPDTLPPFETVLANTERMSPGYTMFDVQQFAVSPDIATEDLPPLGSLIVVDSEGNVVWYHQTMRPIGDARQLDDGEFLFSYDNQGARMVNLLGEITTEWAGKFSGSKIPLDPFGRPVVTEAAQLVETDSMHHEYSVLPNGNHLTISSELVDVDGVAEPLCDDADTFDGTYHLVADLVVEFDPVSLDVVKEVSLADYYDPLTHPDAAAICGPDFGPGFPTWHYGHEEPAAIDWTHANAATYDVGRDAVLVSIRHLDAVLAIDWSDTADFGSVLWELGPHGTLDIDGDAIFHQHAPEIQPDGSVLIYDNGNGRPGGPPFTRAVLFGIDDDAQTATQLWERRSEFDGSPLFAPFVGDADRLENGNMLIVDGAINGTIGDWTGQVTEIVPGDVDGGDEVFNLRVEQGAGWAMYRAERLPTLYPNGAVAVR